MRTLLFKRHPQIVPHELRPMPPGGGLVIAGLASVMLWAVIAAIVAIV